MRSKKATFSLTLILTALLSANSSASLTPCLADGDVNDDGTVLSVADQLFLSRYLSGEEPSIPVPYKADLSGDCTIDFLDALVYEQYFVHGMSAFEPYGGYPVETCCDPDTVHGACCFSDSCAILSPENCFQAGGQYLGDGTLCQPNPCDSCVGQNPGDVNNDGQINVGDATYLIGYLEQGGPAPDPLANADPDGNCCIGYADLAYLICIYHFGSQVEPVDCTCLEPPRCDEHCLPGDATNDSAYSVADAVYIIDYIFSGGPGPYPFAVLSADANGDGIVNVGDAVRIISFVFSNGEPPVACGEWFQSNPCLHPDGYWIYNPPVKR